MFQYSPYFFPLILAAVLGVTSAYFGYQRRQRDGSLWFVLAMFGLTGWALFNGLMVVSEPKWLKLLWFGLFATSGLYLALTWLLFAVVYTGEGYRLTRPVIAGILTIPLPWLLSTVTNTVDTVMLRDVTVVTEGGQLFLQYGYSWLFIAGTGVAWVTTAAATILFFRKALRSRNVYRKMSLFLAFGGGAMVFGSALSTLKLSPFPNMMLVPFFFLFWGFIGLFFFASRRFVRAFPIEKFIFPISTQFNDVVHLGRDSIVEEVDSGVAILDTDGYVVDINETARELFVGPDRIVGQNVYDLVDIDQFFDEFDRDALYKDRRTQVWVDTAEGERCYDINLSTITDDDGNPVGRTVLVVDITEQKEREQELQSQKQDLERQKQQLEHQNERLDRFAGIVSHDLRNPLNVALGRADLLKMNVDGEHGESIETIQGQLERMEAIIDDALTLARSGKAITETTDIDLATVAREAWENVDTGDASLAVDTALHLESDGDRLLNVFENLYRNSVEHNESTDLTVRVGTLPDERGFYVEDTGEGIPEDEREEVLKQGYTTNDEGTGFGLAIVEDIIKAHGWGLSVSESEEGGARFEVECYETPVEKQPPTV